MTNSSVLFGLSKLQHFVEVAQQGSFRAAADKLNVAPSAVSKQIKNLEDHFGVELFRRDRGRGGLELTEAGGILLYRSASVINELSIVREELNELFGLKRGHLRVGVNEVVAADILPGILHNMHRNFPALEYSIIVENTPVILKRLHEGDVDIGLGYNFPSTPEIEVLATLYRQIYLITSRQHALAQRRKVRLEEIAGEQFIFPDPSVALHQMLQDALVRADVEVRTVMRTNSFSLLRQMVQDGLGVSMVIGRFLQSKREELVFIEVEDLGIERKLLSCCRVAGRAPTSSSIAFAGSVKALFAQYGG